MRGADGAGVSRLALAAAVLASALLGALGGASWMRRAVDARPAEAPGAVMAARDEGVPVLRDVPVPRAMRSTADGPASRATLMQQYANALDEDVRGALLARLQRQPDAALRDFALGLVASADADARLRGYALLSAFPLDEAGTREAVLAGLAGERDPPVLASVVDLAVPTMLPASEAAPMASALAALARHQDAAVRARSVTRAAQWAGPGDAEPLLARALVDDAPEVRQAAIAGVIATRAHSPQLKDALLWIAGDEAAVPDQRAAAVFALQWYRLDDGEFAIYRDAEAATGHGH